MRRLHLPALEPEEDQLERLVGRTRTIEVDLGDEGGDGVVAERGGDGCVGRLVGVSVHCLESTSRKSYVRALLAPAERCLLGGKHERPDQVPASARWNADDSEWETGQIVDGIRRGDFTWWRPEGALVARSPFDEEGRLDGICRRYHPDGQISLESRYVSGVRWGKTWHTRSLSGDSPEDVHLALLPPTTFRLEMVYVDGQTAPVTTRLNRAGAASPPHVSGGMLVDWRAEIGKIERGTAFMTIGTPHDVEGRPVEGLTVFFDGAEENDRLRFTSAPPTDASARGLTVGARDKGIVVTVDEAAKYLLLVVDAVDARIVEDRPPLPLGLTLEVRPEGVFIARAEGSKRGAQAGLRADDRIVSVNGTKVITTLDYVGAHRLVAEMQRSEMVVERDGEELTVTVDLTAAAADSESADGQKRGYVWYGSASSEGGPILVADVGSYAAWRGGDDRWDENAVYRVHYYGSLVGDLEPDLRPAEGFHQERLVSGVVAARSFVERLRDAARALVPDVAAREQPAMTAEEMGEKARGDVSAWLPAWRDHLEQGTDFSRDGEVVLHVEVNPDTDYARACDTEDDAAIFSFGPAGRPSRAELGPAGGRRRRRRAGQRPPRAPPPAYLGRRRGKRARRAHPRDEGGGRRGRGRDRLLRRARRHRLGAGEPRGSRGVGRRGGAAARRGDAEPADPAQSGPHPRGRHGREGRAWHLPRLVW